MMAATAISYSLALDQVQFSYIPGRVVLDIPEFKISGGERLFIFGPSGSGKTTLLGLLAGVLRAQKGSVTVLGRDLTKMSNSERDFFRGSHVGYIFQQFNLIPYLTVLENIVLPCRLMRERRERLAGTTAEREAGQLAARLGIEALLAAPVTNLSVGQQQRVAAARALIGRPEIVIADEPTSALDTDHRERFIELLFDSCRQQATTIIFVSHDRTLIPLFDRNVSLPEINRAAAG